MAMIHFIPNPHVIPTRKKSGTLTISTHVSPSVGWSGGSCNYHTVVNLDNNPPQVLAYGNQFNVMPTSQELAPRNILITTGTFMGKPAHPRVTCRPEDKDDTLKLISK